MYAKESQHQKVMVTFYEKMTLATLELLNRGMEILKMVMRWFCEMYLVSGTLFRGHQKAAKADSEHSLLLDCLFFMTIFE